MASHAAPRPHGHHHHAGPPQPKVQLPDEPSIPGATRLVTQGYSFSDADQIGEGTYGRVFRGTDLAHGDKVALKMIRTDNEKEGFPITAIREIKILSNLKHDNIVNLREIVRSEVNHASGYKGAIYMVFDYAEHDLTGMIDSVNGKLTVPQVKCIMLQLLRGLSYCHLNGVLHRDLKAANILITRDGVLKLADFGLARTYLDEGSQKLTNRVITLWYRPPELLLGAEHYDPKVDVWSVGCIFAELLSGRPLFPGRDEADTIRRILEFMGLPTNRTWPGIEEWPFYKDLNKSGLRPDSNAGFQRWCKEHLKEREEAMPLLNKMLTLDPRQRISAADALMDPYFWESKHPPCKHTDLPKPRADSHEFTTKKSRDKRQHQQQQQQQMAQQQQAHHAAQMHAQQQQRYPQAAPYAAGGAAPYVAGGPPAAHGHMQQQPYDRSVRACTGPGGYQGPMGGGGGGAPPPAAPYSMPGAAAPYGAAPPRGAGRGFIPGQQPAARGQQPPPGYQQQRQGGGGYGR